MKYIKLFEGNKDEYHMMDIFQLFADDKLEVGCEFSMPIDNLLEYRLRVTGNEGTHVKWLTFSSYSKGRLKKNEWTIPFDDIAVVPNYFTRIK